VRRREHVRGRGATIVGTSIDLPSPASEKGRKKVPKPIARGNSVGIALVLDDGSSGVFVVYPASR
jgi:hypothetical protein